MFTERSRAKRSVREGRHIRLRWVLASQGQTKTARKADFRRGRHASFRSSSRASLSSQAWCARPAPPAATRSQRYVTSERAPGSHVGDWRWPRASGYDVATHESRLDPHSWDGFVSRHRLGTELELASVARAFAQRRLRRGRIARRVERDQEHPVEDGYRRQGTLVSRRLGGPALSHDGHRSRSDPGQKGAAAHPGR